jgi:hypothetical protein
VWATREEIGRLGEIGPGGDKIRLVVEVVGSSPTGPWVWLGLFVVVEWKV